MLTSRFTQDAVENLFSVIRSKHVMPNVSHFKYDLRIISIALYTRSINSSNYDFDDSYFLNDYLQKQEINVRTKLGTEDRSPLKTITSSFMSSRNVKNLLNKSQSTLSPMNFQFVINNENVGNNFLSISVKPLCNIEKMVSIMLLAV